LAKALGISPLVIGLTIVAFGTSMPKLIINIFAASQGRTDLAIANVVGSNIANVLLILGLSAVIVPLTVRKSTVFKEIPFSLLTVAVLAIMVADRFLEGVALSALTRTEGLVLVAFF